MSAAVFHPNPLKVNNLDTNQVDNYPIAKTAELGCFDAAAIILQYAAIYGPIASHAYLQLQQFLPSASENECLLAFQKLFPRCTLFITEKEPKSLGHNAVFTLDSYVFKSNNPSFEYVSTVARVLSQMPPHPHLNRFLGINIETKRLALVFEKIEGKTWGNDPFPDIATALTVLDVFCYLNRYGIVYDDVKGDNLMITKEGKVVVIDYDFCCFHNYGDEWLKAQRWKFGSMIERLPKCKELATKCQSDGISFKDFGWVEVRDELVPLSKKSSCTIM